ncbi:MAG: Maf family nucleotide pyrophosphatase [Beijerinckiaceae bacterium]
MADSAAGRPKLVLASGSPRRVALLEQIGLKPDALLPVDLDESPRMGEKGLPLAKRLAREKAEAAALKAKDISALAGSFILAADTVVWAVGRVLPKPEQELEAAWCLRKLSGRSHRVFTGIALVTPDGKLREKLVETRVRFKTLSKEEVAAYIASGEWRGKAGGYAIQGLAAAFCQRIIGSYPSVVGLPLAETADLLNGEGFPVRSHWPSAQ